MFRSRNRSLPSGITVSSSTNLDSVVARVRERERVIIYFLLVVGKIKRI